MMEIHCLTFFKQLPKIALTISEEITFDPCAKAHFKEATTTTSCAITSSPAMVSKWNVLLRISAHQPALFSMNQRRGASVPEKDIEKETIFLIN